jgi:hypothetical protein
VPAPSFRLNRHDSDNNPVNEHHDVLVLNRKRRLYRVPVRKAGEHAGDYFDTPEHCQPDHEGYRKVFRVIGESLSPGGTASETTMSVGVLPVKEEPNSSFVCCYIFNALELTPVNYWTLADWNDHPDARVLKWDVDQPPPVSVVLATSFGEALLVKVTGTSATVQQLELKKNPELWQLLRNGCIAGHSKVYAPDGSDEVAALLNLASIDKPPASATAPIQSSDATGTLDFKWPAGKRVRVAIKPLATHPDQSELAIRTFRELAQQWVAETSLALEFTEYQLSDPSLMDYDILVDIDPLPRPIAGDRSRDAHSIELPMSDLGSYALRRKLHQATLYVGKPPGFKDAAGNQIADDAYYASDAFKHIVLHEFGHALGLPHLHQHPEWPDTLFVTVPEFIQRINQKMGVTATEEFVKEHFLLPWPGHPERFSEWPDIEYATESPLAVAAESVMMGLPALCIFRDAEMAPVVYRGTLGTIDRDWIKKLYPAERSFIQQGERHHK